MDAYNTAHTFLSTDSHRRPMRTAVVIGLVAVVILALMGTSAPAQSKRKAKTPPPPPVAESGYSARFKGSEAALVGLDRPYLVLDLTKSLLRLKLRGVTVRDYKFTVAGDADQVKAFRDHAEAGDTVAKSIVRLHVFEREHQLNDTVLGIVAEATTAPADLIQRYRPKRLSVTFSNKLALDVVAAGVGGQSVSWSADLAEELRLFADDLFGGEMLSIQISRDDAMSFYGVCKTTPPLLVAP
jgi:hypothetical protein